MEDIFSFKNFKEENFCEVIVDTREKNSMVPSYLFERKVKVLFRKLDVGDYLVGDLLIERKEVNDFVGSFCSGRLKKQLNNLLDFERRVLLIEGYFENVKSKINKHALRGFELSILTDYLIPIIYTKDEKETADVLIWLGKRGNKHQNN